MVSLEQVKLLETKVSKVIGFVDQITKENVFLKGKLDGYQKRIDELEVVIQRFNEEQNRIEDGILSTLDQLSRFERTREKTILPSETADVPADLPADIPEKVPEQEEPSAYAPEYTVPEEAALPAGDTFQLKDPVEAGEKNAPVEDEGDESDEELIFESEREEDAEADGDKEETADDSSGELDIF